MDSHSGLVEESSLTPSSSSAVLPPPAHSAHIIELLLSEGLPPFRVEVGRGEKAKAPMCPEQQIREKILSYNRKDKSLEELSRKFIDNY